MSFQEYLAASQIKESPKELKEDDLLTSNLDDPWWAETIRLYAAQGDATKLIDAAIAKPTVKSLSLAFDCLQEAAKVESVTRQKLTDLLEAGLESDDPQIAKLAAEVSLLRRLDNLSKVNENLEIDLSYINCAEYRLFLNEQTTFKDLTVRSAKAPITGIEFETALQFCTWLNLKAATLRQNDYHPSISYYLATFRLSLNELVSYFGIYYRLPTAMEIQTYPAKEHKSLKCCLLGKSSLSHSQGLRIVKAKLPSRYTQLFNYLGAQEWEKADRETAKLLPDLEAIAQLATEDLQEIDLLWFYCSEGRFSLGAQVSMLSRLGGKPIVGYFPYLWHSHCPDEPRLLFDLMAQKYVSSNLERLSFEKSLSESELEVVTVNQQGEETHRQIGHARYFSEGLDRDVMLDMVLIPAGSFVMGAPESEKESGDDERPQHEVKVPEFFMSKYQVTQVQWRKVAVMPKVSIDLEPNPSDFKGDNRPVENVSWYEAVEFCARLSEHTGRAYRLPSEAEWEYACRAGTTTPFHFGETITPELVNYDGNNPYGNAPKGLYRQETTPVGSFPANAFGLYDMHGNLCEWCADDWHDNYKGAPTDGSAWIDNSGRLPKNTTSARQSHPIKSIQDLVKIILSFAKKAEKSNDESLKLLRGGSWYGFARNCRAGVRRRFVARNQLNSIGFRVSLACSS